MAEAPSRLSDRAANVLAASTIVVLGLAVYAGTFHVPFLLDDRAAIVDNPTIRRLWPPGALLSPPGGSGLTVEGRPVLNLSFAFNYAFGGTRVESYHAVNLAIHLAAGLVLCGLIRRTLVSARRWPARDAWGFALATSLCWTLHPLATGAVTYISQRAESLMALFYLLTLYGFVRGAESGKNRAWLAFSVACGLLGMGTKEPMVTAPLVVFLYDGTFGAGTFRAAWSQRKKYYLALAATWLLQLTLVAGAGNRGGTIGAAAGVTWWQFALTQSRAVVRYLGLSLWPHPLIFDYGTDLVASTGAVAPFLLLDFGLLALIVYGFRRHRPVAFLGACVFLILAPSSSVVGGTRQMLAEHRMYLPLAAVMLLAMLALRSGLGRRAAWVGSLLALALGAATIARNHDYRDEESLWSDTVAQRPGNAWAQNNLGLALLALGRPAEAADRFHVALRLSPPSLRLTTILATPSSDSGA